MAFLGSLDDSYHMTDFRKLLVWEKAHALAVGIHSLAAEIRKSQYASLRKQMIRAGESVPTNIAEASRQASRRDFARFLRYALNSASELEYHVILATDIGAIARDEGAALIAAVTEVRKMLHGLLRRVSTTTKRHSIQHVRQRDN